MREYLFIVLLVGVWSYATTTSSLNSIKNNTKTIKNTNLTIDHIKYNEQKLSVIRQNKFGLIGKLHRKINKIPTKWIIIMGDNQRINIKEFFQITESNQEQILFRNKLKRLSEQYILSLITAGVGAWVAVDPQTGNTGGYIGSWIYVISGWVGFKSYLNFISPISFESAKNIAEQYNKKLLSEYSN